MMTARRTLAWLMATSALAACQPAPSVAIHGGATLTVSPTVAARRL